MKLPLIIVSIILWSTTTLGQSIWTGAPVTFTKPDSTDWTQAAYQDRITNEVWLTRANSKGVFNIKSESSYVNLFSPEDTEWAKGTTANLASLSFANWELTVSSFPSNMVNQDMVLHLISEDIYIDIKFLSWTVGLGNGVHAGGGFSYMRSSNQSITLSENLSASSVSVFPNPGRDQVQISGLSQASQYKILNVLGSVVQLGTARYFIDLGALNSGVYLIKFQDFPPIRFVKE